MGRDGKPTKVVREPRPASPKDSAVDPAFFPEIKRDLDELQAASDVLICIPTWAWTGDGKTCGLLTAVHFCNLTQHGLALARVKAVDDLTALEDAVDQYRGLGLAALAEATASRLQDLNETFFVENAWPPGTEAASQYLFEIRTQRGRSAYALLPDLRGGSYQQPDNPHRAVAASAHAYIVLVNPDRYVDPSPRGKEYKDDVIGQLQRCSRDGLPTCVMLGQADRFTVDTDCLDRTRKELSVLLEPLGPLSKIFHVSVVGDSPIADGSLPPLQERNPEQLIRAWAWIVHQALTQPREHVMNRVPATNLEEGGKRVRLKTTPKRELRIVRDEQSGPGNILCAMSSTQGERFLFLGAETPTLAEVVLDLDSDDHRVRELGVMEDWEEPQKFHAHTRDGTLFIGEKSGTTTVWHGSLGQSPRPSALPYPLEAWTSLSQRLLVGVDDKGTLHTMSHSGGKWNAKGYLHEFISPSTRLSIGILAQENAVYVANGSTVEAVAIDSRGKIGARQEVGIAVAYSGPFARLNSLGFIAAPSDGNTVVAGREKAFKIGAYHPEAIDSIALASESATIAWVSPEQHLCAAYFIGPKATVFAPEQSPRLEELPNRLVWSLSGNALAIGYASGRWAWARRLGV